VGQDSSPAAGVHAGLIPNPEERVLEAPADLEVCPTSRPQIDDTQEHNVLLIHSSGG